MQLEKKWQKILYDPGSTTKAFKFLTSDYTLDVLFSQVEDGHFKRVVVIKLDQIPVMVALSMTNICNPLFLDILQNSATTPIGVRLFASDSSISRGIMQVTKISLALVFDNTIKQYISTIADINEIYHRQSVFSHENETLELHEYVLPGLKEILAKYSQRI